MECPKCRKNTRRNKEYKLDLCINKYCELYLKDDVSKFKGNPRKNLQLCYDKSIGDALADFDFDLAMELYTWMQVYKITWTPKNVNELRTYVDQRVRECIISCESSETQIYLTVSGLLEVEVDLTEGIFIKISMVPVCAASQVF